MTRLGLLFMLALLMSGCASRGTVSQATQLADAGIAYGAAAAEIIPVTRDRYLAWSTDSLAEESLDQAHCSAADLVEEDESNQTPACRELRVQFADTRKTYQEFVESLATLQAHAEALGRYFQNLKALAAYDSNAAASGAAGRLVDRINGLSKALESKATISDAQKSAWASMAGLVGDAIKAKRLRARLEADAEAITRAIDLQDAVLRTSVATLAALDAGDREVAFLRDVESPYLRGDVKDRARWQAAFRTSLLPGPGIASIRTLQSASERLHDVWEAILSGEATPESAQAVFEDIAAALNAIDAIRRANGAQE